MNVSLTFAFFAFFCLQLVYSEDNKIDYQPCPDGCKCYFKRSLELIIFFGCKDRGYVELPKSIPLNVTDLNFPSNKLAIITKETFSRFSDLQSLYLKNNRIEVISDDAFDSLKKLQRLDLTNNTIRIFPWRSLLKINLKILLLEHNRVRTLPSSRAVLDRLSTANLLLISHNPILCCCNLTVFANWMSANVGSKNYLYCSSKFGWVNKTLQEFKRVNSASVTCRKPRIHIFAQNGSKKWLITSRNQELTTVADENISTIAILEGSNVTFECRKSDSNATLKTTLLLSRTVQPRDNNKILWSNDNQTSIRNASRLHDRGKFLCGAENEAGTTVIEVQVKLIPSIHPSQLEDECLSEENTTISETTKISKLSEHCGPMRGLNVTLAKSVRHSPTIYKTKFSSSETVLFKELPTHRIVHILLTGFSDNNDQVQLCHTSGFSMMYRLEHLTKSTKKINIRVKSFSPHYLVCIKIPSKNYQMCGNFTITPTPQDNMFVMFIVGGFLLSIGTVPLLLACCQAARGDSFGSLKNSHNPRPATIRRKRNLQQHTKKGKEFPSNQFYSQRSNVPLIISVEEEVLKKDMSPICEPYQSSFGLTRATTPESFIQSLTTIEDAVKEETEIEPNTSTVEVWLNNLQFEKWSPMQEEKK